MLTRLHCFMVFFVVTCVLVTPAAAAPLVLFDESHAQQFLVGGEGPLDLSGLGELLRTDGYAVEQQAGPLTPEALARADVLVMSGPFKPLDDAELQAVMNFIDGGGGLAVMLHIAPPVGPLLERLEVDYTNGTLRESALVIGDNPLNFQVVDLVEHPLTAGLEGFSLYGAWALRGTAPHVRVLAETGERSWVDLDRNNQLSSSDAVQKFGVMVAGELGRGRYVVFGDDALFQNRFLDGPNRQLALNLVRWLSFR